MSDQHAAINRWRDEPERRYLVWHSVGDWIVAVHQEPTHSAERTRSPQNRAGTRRTKKHARRQQ